MVDSLRSRVTRFIAGGAHALMDRMESLGPLAVLEQSTREVDQLAAEVRTELGQLVASRHLTQQRQMQLNREYEELALNIEAALMANREDLARPAIARQIDIEAQLPVLDSSLAEKLTQERELTGYIEALIGRRREMESSIRQLETARQIAEHGSSDLTAGGVQVQQRLASAEAAFARIYQRQAGVVTDPVDLEQATKLRELAELARNSQVDARLAALKSR